MHTLIVGAGAVGGFLADRLVDAGQDVTVLVRPHRATTLRRDGLQVLDADGRHTNHPEIVTADQLKQRDDTAQLIILAVKGNALDSALDDIDPAVGANTIVLPFLNGMHHLDRLQQRYGAAVIGGTLRIATELLDDDSIRVIAPMFAVELGALSETTESRIRDIAQQLRDAGAQVTVPDDITTAMWAKWLFIASVGALTASMRAPIGDIIATPGGIELAHRLLDELTATMTAAGCAPAPRVVEMTKAVLTADGSPLTSSLSRDLIAGRHRGRARARGLPRPRPRRPDHRAAADTGNRDAAHPQPADPRPVLTIGSCNGSRHH